MKRVVLAFMVVVFCILNVTAQDAHTLHNGRVDAVVDSLSFELNKLQKDYDFLRCDYEVKVLKNELSILYNKIDINANTMLIYYYNSSFNYELYKAFKDNYEAQLNALESLKKKIATVTSFVTLKILLSDFSDTEVDFLQTSLDYFDVQIDSAETALKRYKMAIDAYLKS